MAKQTIEIDVPEGMQVGEMKQVCEHIEICLKPIPKTKWRAPTKMDLLGVDSIPCRVRDNTESAWCEAFALVSVVTNTSAPYIIKGGMSWKLAEIEVPVDEKPPREAWVRYYGDNDNPWGHSFSSKEAALLHKIAEAEVIHMIEVKE